MKPTARIDDIFLDLWIDLRGNPEDRNVGAADLMARCDMEPDPWQRSLLTSESKRSLLLCTRQAGKSTTTAVLALWQLLYRPGSLVLMVSPSLRQSQELYRKMHDFYTDLGRPVAEKNSSALRLELVNGSRCLSLPATESTIRGYSAVDLLLIDEASRVEDDLYRAVRPMLAVSDGTLVAMTTPWGKRGWFYEEWDGSGNWERHKITAYECPRITAEFLEEERKALGDWWFRQEYLCEFNENQSTLLELESIKRALVESPKLSGNDLAQRMKRFERKRVSY